MTHAFEWDEAKRLRNLAKHGIDFSRADDIFNGPLLDPYGRRDMPTETRFTAIGRLSGPDGGLSMVVAVVYTWRGARRRIISIRAADGRERAAHRVAHGRPPLA